MTPAVRALEDRDHEMVVTLSLRAWAPVFSSVERILGPSGVYSQLHPDWRVTQRRAVEAALVSPDMNVWVADVGAAVAGFVAVTLHDEESIGEIHMVAVDPAFQRTGIGSALISFATTWIKEQGRAVALVGTGGDPGHAPARHAYERVGFTAFPIIKYFKKLE
jgi:GNAT superfamily N-acetyltransferase